VCAAAVVVALARAPRSEAIDSEPDRPGDALACLAASPGPSREMSALQRKIESATTLDEAREIATRDTLRAQSILGRARRIAPGSVALADARSELDAYHARVARASSRSDVAGAFSTTFTPKVKSCDFSTGEIIAIVLGFILGIIPGIILLILLC